jgi:hypothetical protein
MRRYRLAAFRGEPEPCTYAGAINGKHYGLAAIFSIAGIGLSAVAFAVALEEKRSADQAEPALTALQGQLTSKLNISSIHKVSAGRERGIMTVAPPMSNTTARITMMEPPQRRPYQSFIAGAHATSGPKGKVKP